MENVAKNNPNSLKGKEALENPNIFRIFGEKTTRQFSRMPGEDSDAARREIFEAFGNDFPLDDFLTIHEFRTILSDARYVEKKKREYGEEKFRAKNLENVMRFGVEKAGWLDNGEETLVFPTSKYDDYNNRMDFAVAIRQPEDVSEGRSKKLPFGIDVTYNKTAIDDKLSRQTNDVRLAPTLLPSHSRLKYYDDGEEIGDKIAPRFVLAVDYLDDDRMTKESPNSPGMQRTRFKVLSELIPQAEALSSRLSELDPDEEKEVTRNANDIYENLDGALRDATNAILTSDHISFRSLQYEVKQAEALCRANNKRSLTFQEKVNMITADLAEGDEVYEEMMRKLGKIN